MALFAYKIYLSRKQFKTPINLIPNAQHGKTIKQRYSHHSVLLPLRLKPEVCITHQS